MNWNELKIYQFQELYSILNDAELDDLGKLIYCIAFIEGKEVKEIEALTLPEFNKLTVKYDWLKDMNFNEKAEDKLELNGKTYHVIWQLEKMKAGQYIDLTEFNKEPISNMHKIMATLLYDDWNNYSTEHSERAELFRKQMNIGFAYPLCVFFCERLTKSIPAILKAMAKDRKMKIQELQLMLIRQKIASSNIGVGVSRFTNFLKRAVKLGKK